MAKLNDIEKVCRALGSARRLQIIQFLKGKKAGANVATISEAIKLSYKSTSHHLRLLAARGLLARDQRSADAVYSIITPTDSTARHIFDLL